MVTKKTWLWCTRVVLKLPFISPQSADLGILGYIDVEHTYI